MNREQLKQQIVRNFEDAEITEKERLINVMQCIDAHIEQLRIGVVIQQRELLEFFVETQASELFKTQRGYSYRLNAIEETIKNFNSG